MRRTLLVFVLTLPAVLALLLAALMSARAAAHAQVTPFPVTLTMTGPTMAVSGEEVTYRVHYQLTDLSSTDIVIGITQGATYVSTQVTSGPAGLLAEQTERRVRWSGLGSPEETEGEVELIVKIDANFVGSIFANAYVPGTETTESNVVETQVLQPGRLPETGGGGPAPGSGPLVVPALFALVGAALIRAGAATRRMRRAR